MTNLERKLMASQGYTHPFNNSVNFATWANKPDEPAPKGYEYVPYMTQFGNKRWKLAKSKDAVTLMKNSAPEALKTLFRSGVEPGTTGNALSQVANQAIDTVTENS